MSHSGPDLLTISPQMLVRAPFVDTDRALRTAYPAFDLAWLAARLGDGLQIRMLPQPGTGLVLFCPGQMAWRPVLGVAAFAMVHDLRVMPGPRAAADAAQLWRGVEDWARYFGYAGVAALIGDGPGLVPRGYLPRRHYARVDQGRSGEDLIVRVLQGPVALPQLARDCAERAARLGPGLVVQTTGEATALAARAERVLRVARRWGLPARLERFQTAADTQAHAVNPAALFGVWRDGVQIGGPGTSDAELRKRITA